MEPNRLDQGYVSVGKSVRQIASQLEIDRSAQYPKEVKKVTRMKNRTQIIADLIREGKTIVQAQEILSKMHLT